MRDERLGERAPVARLQDRRLHLDEAPRVEEAADGGHHLAADEEVAPRLLVDEQVEVTLAITSLRVDDPVVRVRQRPLDLRQELELRHRERRLAALRLRRVAAHADDVAQVDVEPAQLFRLGQELDLPASVDEVEEDELPHVAAAQHPAGERVLSAGRLRLERLRLRPDGSDLVPIGEAVRSAHDRASLEGSGAAGLAVLAVIVQRLADRVGLDRVGPRVGLGRQLERCCGSWKRPAWRPDRNEVVLGVGPARLGRRIAPQPGDALSRGSPEAPESSGPLLHAESVRPPRRP